MMLLAGMHMHHAAGGWPIWIGIGVLLLVVACVAVALLARRPAIEGAGGRIGSYANYGGSATGIADAPETEAEADVLDARILGMLRQKGEPMPQTEIAAILGMDPVALGSWLAGMERRERLGRTWNTEQATYVVHLRDEA